MKTQQRPGDNARTATQSMRAVLRESYGAPELVLRLGRVSRPGIEPDEVLVRVRAAGVDRGVWHIVTGLPYPIRVAGFGVRTPKNVVVGIDVAGVIHAVGSGVTRFSVGDEVFGTGQGTFAEFARAFAGRAG